MNGTIFYLSATRRAQNRQLSVQLSEDLSRQYMRSSISFNGNVIHRPFLSFIRSHMARIFAIVCSYQGTFCFKLHFVVHFLIS